MSSGEFQDGWIQDEHFQEWLVKVSNDSRRAYCRVCAIVLAANRGDLASHGRTQSHIANAKIAQESGIPTGPISVQIVSNDDNDFPGPSGGGEEPGDGIEHEQKPEFSTPPRPTQKRKATSGGKTYIKRYRPAWEEEEEFKEWLQGYPDDVERAFCRACKAILRAHKHDLTCHARTARHLKKIQEYKEENGGEQLFQMIAEDIVTIPQTKRVTETIPSHTHNDVSEIGIEIDTSGIFPDDGNLSGSGSGSDHKGSRVKLSKASVNPKRDNHQKLFNIRKRPRFTAADVVHAIETDEFTGYEMLQIVKAAVPKL